MMALGIGPGRRGDRPRLHVPGDRERRRALRRRGPCSSTSIPTPSTSTSRGSPTPSPTRTKAVLAVHLFGRPVEWEELQTAVPQEVRADRGRGRARSAPATAARPAASLGVMGCLSFHPRKIVTTGEGGAVTTDDAELADAIRRFRHHGIVPARRLRHPRARPQLPAARPPLRDRDPAARPARAAARRARAGGRLVHRAARAPRPDALGGRGRPPRLAGVRRPARPSRRGAATRCGRRGSRCRSAPMRCTTSAPTATGAAFPGADRAFARALALPFATTMTEAECDRVAACRSTPLRLGRATRVRRAASHAVRT